MTSSRARLRTNVNKIMRCVLSYDLMALQKLSQDQNVFQSESKPGEQSYLVYVLYRWYLWKYVRMESGSRAGVQRRPQVASVEVRWVESKTRGVAVPWLSLVSGARRRESIRKNVSACELLWRWGRSRSALLPSPVKVHGEPAGVVQGLDQKRQR